MGLKCPIHITFGSMAALFSSLPWQWKRPSPAPGAALRKVFVGGQGRRAARRPSGRRPSRFPRLRVPRTERTSTQVAQPAAGNPSTNARPKEMPMKQRDPE